MTILLYYELPYISCKFIASVSWLKRAGKSCNILLHGFVPKHHLTEACYKEGEESIQVYSIPVVWGIIFSENSMNDECLSYQIC